MKKAKQSKTYFLSPLLIPTLPIPYILLVMSPLFLLCDNLLLRKLYLISSIETFIINNSPLSSSSSSNSSNSNNNTNNTNNNNISNNNNNNNCNMMMNINQEISNSVDFSCIKNHQVIIDPSITANSDSIAQQLINNSSYYCPQGTTVQLNDQTIVNYITENDIINEHNNKLKCLNKRKQVYFFKPY